jgi:uncharacterized phage protein (TIGR02220 family)
MIQRTELTSNSFRPPPQKSEAVDSLPRTDHAPIVASAMQRLNEQAGLTYKLNSKVATKHIGARINEGFTEKDFLCVVDYKCAKWKGDPKMERYLRPETLFNLDHFESYLQEAKAADHVGHQRSGFVA